MTIGRALIAVGLVVAAVGALLVVSERWNLPLGRLPGDLLWRRGGTVVYIPLATCLLISLVLTIGFWLFGKR